MNDDLIIGEPHRWETLTPEQIMSDIRASIKLLRDEYDAYAHIDFTALDNMELARFVAWGVPQAITEWYQRGMIPPT